MRLNQAWGIALAPSDFGPLSNTLLISNNSVDGTINGFNPKTGKFVGTIRNQWGRKIVLNNLWGIAFGGGTTNNGPTNRCSLPWVRGLAPANWLVPLRQSSSIHFLVSIRPLIMMMTMTRIRRSFQGTGAHHS